MDMLAIMVQSFWKVGYGELCISFNCVGSYTYIVKQLVNENLPGYNYDEEEYIIKIYTKLDSSGKLDVSGWYVARTSTQELEGAIEIVNSYGGAD